jgi:hypothetical protein
VSETDLQENSAIAAQMNELEAREKKHEPEARE